MLKIPSAEVAKNFGYYQDKALAEPVTVRKYNRDSVVIIRADEYARLKKLDRQVRAIEELNGDDMELLSSSRMSPEHDHLNDLMD